MQTISLQCRRVYKDCERHIKGHHFKKNIHIYYLENGYNVLSVRLINIHKHCFMFTYFLFSSYYIFDNRASFNFDVNSYHKDKNFTGTELHHGIHGQ